MWPACSGMWPALWAAAVWAAACCSRMSSISLRLHTQSSSGLTPGPFKRASMKSTSVQSGGEMRSIWAARQSGRPAGRPEPAGRAGTGLCQPGFALTSLHVASWCQKHDLWEHRRRFLARGPLERGVWGILGELPSRKEPMRTTRPAPRSWMPAASLGPGLGPPHSQHHLAHSSRRGLRRAGSSELCS